MLSFFFRFNTAQNTLTNQLVLSCSDRPALPRASQRDLRTRRHFTRLESILSWCVLAFISTASISLPSYVLSSSPSRCRHRPIFSTFRDKLIDENMFNTVWNIACGFAQNTPELLVFRFLAGLGGSAPLSVRLSFCFILFVNLTSFLPSCSSHMSPSYPTSQQPHGVPKTPDRRRRPRRRLADARARASHRALLARSLARPRHRPHLRRVGGPGQYVAVGVLEYEYRELCGAGDGVFVFA